MTRDYPAESGPPFFRLAESLASSVSCRGGPPCLFGMTGVRGAMAFLALIALTLCVFAADAGKGEAIGKHWCAASHVVSFDRARANSDVPSFVSITHKKQRSETVKTLLTDPHPKCPSSEFLRQKAA